MLASAVVTGPCIKHWGMERVTWWQTGRSIATKVFVIRTELRTIDPHIRTIAQDAAELCSSWIDTQ